MKIGSGDSRAERDPKFLSSIGTKVIALKAPRERHPTQSAIATGRDSPVNQEGANPFSRISRFPCAMPLIKRPVNAIVGDM